MITPNTTEGFREVDDAYQQAKSRVETLEASHDTSSAGCCDHTVALHSARAALSLAGVKRDIFVHHYPDTADTVFEEDHARLVSPAFSE